MDFSGGIKRKWQEPGVKKPGIKLLTKSGRTFERGGRKYRDSRKGGMSIQ